MDVNLSSFSFADVCINNNNNTCLYSALFTLCSNALLKKTQLYLY